MPTIRRREFLAAAVAGPFREARPGYRFQFPRDHFDHPDFRTEWWYYTGNVRSGDKPFGFELVFFRQAQRRGESDNRSAWRADDLYLAHLALTDVAARRHYSKKRLNRAGPGLAGASFGERRVWNGNWSSRWSGNAQRLEALAPEFRFTLDLAPLKPPVVHGVDGVSQKAEGAGKASHYVSFTRLEARGKVETGGRAYSVAGLAWMDHEWFTHQLEESQQGWDWFSIQLDDGRDVMLFQLRRKDGAVDPNSSGTLVGARGAARRLARGEFALEPASWWTSPKSGARYPTVWRLQVPTAGLDLECRAVLDEQEMQAEGMGGPTYWEGAVEYSGSARGRGYLEMTGYDRKVVLD